MSNEDERLITLDMMIALFILGICNEEDVLDVSRQIYK